MPSDKMRIVARHKFVRKFTRKLYRRRLRCSPRGRSQSRTRSHTSAIHFSNLKNLRMRRIIDNMSEPTRRWPRVPVDMPVRVVTSKGFSTTVVEGRGTELSEGGMVLYAGILLNPGDLLEIEFETPTLSKMTAVVRSRNGFCFGLEFITPLPQ